MKTGFKIKGMHCSGCAMGIEMTLKFKEGLKNVKVDFANEKVDFEFNSDKIRLPEIKKTVSDMGFEVD